MGHHHPGISAIIASTSGWARSRRTVLEGRDQARYARRQARLIPIRGRGLIHIARRSLRISGPARAIASPMAAGRRRLSAICAVRRNSKCEFPFIAERSRTAGASDIRKTSCTWELDLGISAKCVAILLLPIALAACAGSDDGRSISLYRRSRRRQPAIPNNYRAELLAFMKTYLNNPVGVHDAVDGRAGAAHRRRPAALCQLPAFCPARIRRQLSRAARARHSLRRWPARPRGRECRRDSAPARSMRRFPNWKR